MASDTTKKQVRDRKYLNKTFNALRSDLLTYARSYYGDRIKDFSDASIGGLFLDMAAYVGDVTSFYMDHQFTELDPLDAVETINIERHLKNSGVPIVGSSPAVSYVNFTIVVPALQDDTSKPNSSLLPTIRQGTSVTSDSGIVFNLIEDIDFTKLSANGNYVASMQVARTNSANIPTAYYMTLPGLCLSGFYETETFGIGTTFVPFRRITLSNANVTDIVSVSDSSGNSYVEVNDLSEDVVFRGILNRGTDGELVKENLGIYPAPYRFKKEVDLGTRLTTLVFGGGSADTFDDDVVPDPSEFALPLYGKRTFPIASINPSSLLRTKTLGVATTNTTLTITYRWGGGLDHNVEAGAIQDIQTLVMEFPNSPSAYEASSVRSSVTVTNPSVASGGEDPPTVDELRIQIPQIKNSQARIVTKEDLLARVYTMPSNFGRVFRASIRSNPNNPLASQLFIISRDANSNLIVSPDALKDNLKVYLNQYRMISDAIDILDAGVINLRLDFEIVVDAATNKQIVLQNVLKNLKSYFNIKNFSIDQPIITSDIVSVIFKAPGVVSINNRPNNQMLKFTNITGNVNNKQYSNLGFDVISNTVKGMIIPPNGAIFELRYPDTNIVGTVI